MFRSRFAEGSGAFPLRQYLRCREEMFSSVIQVLILSVFIITLLVFARTLDQMFVAHAESLEPWYRWVALGGMAVMVLLVVRRLWQKIRETQQLRQEMRRLRPKLPPEQPPPE